MFAIDAIFVAIAALIVLAGISHARVKNLSKEVEDLRDWIAEVQMVLEEVDSE